MGRRRKQIESKTDAWCRRGQCYAALSDRLLAGAFERVRHEWPWIEMFAVWNLSYTSLDAEMQGFSIIEPNRSPRPAFDVISRLRRQLDRASHP